MAINILENSVANREWDLPNASAHFPFNPKGSTSALSSPKVLPTTDLSSLEGAGSKSFNFTKLYVLSIGLIGLLALWILDTCLVYNEAVASKPIT